MPNKSFEEIEGLQAELDLQRELKKVASLLTPR